MTRVADLKQRIEEGARRLECLETLVDLLRYETDETSTMILARLRLGASIVDIVDMYGNSQHGKTSNALQTSCAGDSSSHDA